MPNPPSQGTPGGLPPVILTSRLALLPATPAILNALLARDLTSAEDLTGARIPPAWVEQAAAYLTMRRGELQADPARQRWLDRLVVLQGEGQPLVGHVGFHGPPDDRGVLEVGYRMLEAYRSRGIAGEAVKGLLDWAWRDAGVTTFRASIAPQNVPSLRLADRLGFQEVGRQVDEDDGEELVFEVAWPSPGGTTPIQHRALARVP